MTNNDELALSRKEFEAIYNETHSVQITPAFKRFGYYTSPTMQKAWELWQQARKPLLAERDADKKRIAELEKNNCGGALMEREEHHVGVVNKLLGHIAELEARTVSVKLPDSTQLSEAPEHIWLQTAGEWPATGEFSELTWCSDRQHPDDTLYVRADLAAGIKLEVGE